ncbi:MAG: DNA-directed RNA polymerase subunit alpha C-terminal domain-containing protein [Bacillota bacterium]|nr:DNA-directed RNA polymerase subunit alpha C-terminal domain-containing protein [Bacillota bacterium]
MPTYNILKIAGIDTINDVYKVTDSFLLNLRGFGSACLNDLLHRMEVFKAQKKLKDEKEF